MIVQTPLDPADQQLLDGVLGGSRRDVARVITLLESALPEHRRRADVILQALIGYTGKSLRLGISGVPGAGKSTFIESLGVLLLSMGHRVAVLSIDPSSSVTGGSILADKTRMPRLASSEGAYIRPSPSSGTLGGVAAATREAVLVCEAAGYDVVMVETVGVGQSESAVTGLTDLLLVLQVPNTGDELQAIKRGLLEVADLIVVNKCDLDAGAARRAAAQMQAARRQSIRCISALANIGLAELWTDITQLQSLRAANGELRAKRQRQNVEWLWELMRAGLEQRLRRDPSARAMVAEAEAGVHASRLEPRATATALLDRFTRMR
jgi:LAO/AO transport system kinase